MELFATQTAATERAGMPLAARLRPRRLEDVVGQKHLLAPGKLLRRAIEADRIGSLILFGPPGCGKTTLAEVIAAATSSRFERTSGVLANVAVLRRLLEAARLLQQREGRRTLLFIDEIHHFNKSQQDILLPYVEDGSVVLIGATTHNPFFFVNSPLTSRSQVFELEPLAEEDVLTLLRRALDEPAQFVVAGRINVAEDALRHLARMCDGDARRALNALELAVLSTPPSAQDGVTVIDRNVAADSIQKKVLVYDRDEDGHYDTVSAFIKSVRGSDPHAAVYWLAKMIEAGEDPRFIARRLVILASEDIGNADPRGLLIATAALQAVGSVGMPEARITLSQAVTYLACAPKSNAAYLAVEKALDDVRRGRTLPVPKPLRGSGYRGAARLGHSGYKYAHDHEGHFVDQEYVPADVVYYEPVQAGYEEIIARRLAHWESLRIKKPAKTATAAARSANPAAASEPVVPAAHSVDPGPLSGAQSAKHEWRRRITARLRRVGARQWQESGCRVAEAVRSMEDWQNSRRIAVYLNTDDEIPTAPLIDACRQRHCELHLPVFDVQRQMYLPAAWGSDDVLQPGKHGLPEPVKPRWALSVKLDMVIVPGRGFTRSGGRLGRGGGHYDRFLSGPWAAAAVTAGLALERQLIDAEITEPHDVAMNWVVTEKGIHAGAARLNPR